MSQLDKETRLKVSLCKELGGEPSLKRIGERDYIVQCSLGGLKITIPTFEFITEAEYNEFVYKNVDELLQELKGAKSYKVDANKIIQRIQKGEAIAPLYVEFDEATGKFVEGPPKALLAFLKNKGITEVPVIIRHVVIDARGTRTRVPIEGGIADLLRKLQTDKKL